MYRLLVIALLACGVCADIVDRIAITVGSHVITELQIDEEVRVTAFLNDQPLTESDEARRSAADRLVQQSLVEHEMEMSRYPSPNSADVSKYVEGVRAEYGSTEGFDQALAAYGLTLQTLRDHLALQLTTLRFVEFRFRPDLDVSDSDIRSYYQKEAAEWKMRHPGVPPPSFASSRESIRRILIDARTDEVLDTWLAETRKELRIVYLDKSLR